MKQLSENILDIAENSVKARASLIEIILEENPLLNTLSIEIRDNGCGMDNETLERVTNPFYTTRTTRKVGLGIPFFKMGAEMTGGTFHIESKVGQGTVIGTMYHTDHVDFIPLGDIASTLMTLIGGAPEIDFVYKHTRGEKEVLLDTRQLRETLGDISLDTPEVLIWIRDYINEMYDAFNN